MLPLEKLHTLRRTLHAHPEVSGDERATAARIFISRFPCCMFGLGAGEDMPALHNPDYDFPDAILESGVRVFKEVLRAVMERG